MYIVDNCRIIEEDSAGITTETDLVEHRTLLEDLTKSFFTKKSKYQKSRKKNWTRLFCGESVFNNKNLQWF